MTAVLYKVYCYRGNDKQVWFEVEDMTTGQGVAWSPSRVDGRQARPRKLGYQFQEHSRPVLKFYRAQAS